MHFTADRVAGEGEGSRFIRSEGYIGRLAGFDPIRQINLEILQAEPMYHVAASQLEDDPVAFWHFDNRFFDRLSLLLPEGYRSEGRNDASWWIAM